MKGPTPEEVVESERAAKLPPQQTAEGRRAAVTALLLVAGTILLAFVRPRMAGTIAVFGAIILMIMLHELGHFVMAKRAGMKVTEFFLGFGPRLWSIRRGETEYGVKAIPAGGYVRIIGMSSADEVDPADEERTYRAKPYRHRLGVAVAGSAMHFIIATILLFIIQAVVGIPTRPAIIAQIVADSPAQHSDFRLGDRIVAVNGQPVKDWNEIPAFVESHGEADLVFTVVRKDTGERADVALRPRKVVEGGKEVPRVGIGPERTIHYETKPIPSAIGSTVTEMPKFMWTTVKALGGIFSPSGLENYSELLQGKKDANENNRLMSPVGVARVAGNAVESGWFWVLMLLFSINVFVGIFNLVPLLPLDGGHVAIATYEKIASKIKGHRVQVDVQRLMPITAAVLALIVILGLTALYLDIVRPVS
ncbi:MAG TPA: M50 family metallopeptidase [Acidimicrobiia bacterium]|nr:M50 family metallopeptidase [Acidimicrobiia bacterium]